MIFIFGKDGMKLYDEWGSLYEKEDVLLNIWDKLPKLIINKTKTSKTYQTKNHTNQYYPHSFNFILITKSKTNPQNPPQLYFPPLFHIKQSNLTNCLTKTLTLNNFTKSI
ncbi:hypothetical protein, partial [Staphylococcus pasteuri]|uniref:hypothetical protein n=1 Tax=Staphylococcus pasteuri TaxID=45972 RepID=UPI001C99DD62